eukprot:766460-Hanusia_phi.AAC.2
MTTSPAAQTARCLSCRMAGSLEHSFWSHEEEEDVEGRTKPKPDNAASMSPSSRAKGTPPNLTRERVEAERELVRVKAEGELTLACSHARDVRSSPPAVAEQPVGESSGSKKNVTDRQNAGCAKAPSCEKGTGPEVADEKARRGFEGREERGRECRVEGKNTSKSEQANG